MAARPGDLSLSAVPMAAPNLCLSLRAAAVRAPAAAARRICVPNELEGEMVLRAGSCDEVPAALAAAAAAAAAAAKSNDEPRLMEEPKDRSPNSDGRSSCWKVGEEGC